MLVWALVVYHMSWFPNVPQYNTSFVDSDVQMHRINKHVWTHTYNTAHHEIFRPINTHLDFRCLFWFWVLLILWMPKSDSERYYFGIYRRTHSSSTLPTSTHPNQLHGNISSCKPPNRTASFCESFSVLFVLSHATVLCHCCCNLKPLWFAFKCILFITSSPILS